MTQNPSNAPAPVRAARLIVLDERGFVLLFQYATDRGPCWATPGGRLEAGEDFQAAAAREAWEELGIRTSPETPVWEELVEFVGRGRPVERHQQYFRINVLRGEFRDAAAINARRAEEGVLQARWWPPADLVSTVETVHPATLGDLLQSPGRGCNPSG